MDNIKEIVKEKYGKIAIEVKESSCGCSSTNAGGCKPDPYRDIGDAHIADLGLGCGIPTEFADLRKGMTVLDLGSGAGIDAFISSKEVGPTGKVIGLDMTAQMIQRAEENAKKLKVSNVEFRLGEIEQMPVDSGSIDRVISNCVVNLVPDKRKAFAEIYRVLKPGGKFAISDVVTTGTMPENIRKDAGLWAGCVAGATDKDNYIELIHAQGFRDVSIVKEKPYHDFSSETFHILSITVLGTK